MKSLRRILIDLIIILAVVFTGYYLYITYGEQVRAALFDEQRAVILIENLAVEVTIAETPDERRQGLSGVRELEDLEGKLFVFEEEAFHHIWMKDMLFAIDIIFIDEHFKVVDIVENVAPETYPATFTSSVPARFVLETNAYFTESFKVKEGQYVTIPLRYVPAELRESL